MRERCACVSSIGLAASISGSKKSPCAASARTSITESASSLESGILAPAQRDHERLLAVGAPHVGGHLLGAHELERAPREDEAVALLQARDEAFLDDADLAAREVLHLHRCVAHDRADVELVAARDRAVRHAIDALGVGDDAVVLGVGVQARAAPRRRSRAPTGTRPARACGRPTRLSLRRTSRRR